MVDCQVGIQELGSILSLIAEALKLYGEVLVAAHGNA
jgi:hypothetical protein